MAQVKFVKKSSAGDMQDHDGSADSLQIVSLGVGVASPGSGLQLSGGNFVFDRRLLAPAHANNAGLRLPTNAGVPTAVTGTQEGDIVYDTTGNTIYCYDGSAFSQVGGSADAFVQGGNTFGALAVLGTNDAFGLAFEANGSEVARFLTSGNFGVGTTSPSYLLEIRKDQNGITTAAATNSTDGTLAQSVFQSTAGSTVGLIGVTAPSYTPTLVFDRAASLNAYTAGAGGVALAATHASGFVTIHTGSAGAERMRVTSTGTVGINTTTAAARLEIRGVGYPAGTGVRPLRIYDSEGAQANFGELSFSNNGATRGFTFYTDDTENSGNNLFQVIGGAAGTSKFNIDLNGNVGIATASPGSTLDVKGTLRLSGSTSGYVGLAPAADAGSTTYTLPSADGTNGQILRTDGAGVLSWASGNALGVSISGDLSGSRSFSSVYQNTTGKPMLLEIRVDRSITGTSVLYVDSAASPTTVVESVSGTSGFGTSLDYIVPAGYYYKLTNDTAATITSWRENTLDGGSTPLAATIAYQTPWIGTPTAARALSTTYRNETGKPLWVQIWGTHASATDHILWAHPTQALVDAENSAAWWGDNNSANGTVTAVIPVGWYYRKSGGTSIVRWVEWSLEGGGGAGGVPAGGSYGTSQSANLSSLRALGTVYQNTTGKPMFLSFFGVTSGGSASPSLYCDANTTPTTIVTSTSGIGASAGVALTHVIPPNFYYKVAYTFGSGTLNSWFESSIDGTPLGATVVDETANRALTSTYQNTTGKPLLVMVNAKSVVAGHDLYFYISATTTFGTPVADNNASNGGTNTVTVLVPPSWYYKATTDGGATLTKWVETTLDGGGASSLLAGTMGMTNNDVSASRVTETVYQNTTGKAMVVQVNRSINASTPGGQGRIFRAYVGPTSSPTTEIAEFHGLATWPGTLTFSVPQGHYYKIADSDLALPSTSIEWIETTIDGAPLGATQSSNLIGSRSGGISYQNTTGKPFFLSIHFGLTGTGTAQLFCDASPTPTTEVSSQSSSAGFRSTLQHVVPPGFYYKITTDQTFSFVGWFESTIDGGGGGGTAIGYNISGATAGSILFAGTSGILSQNNANLFWDDANNRLSIAANSPLTARLTTDLSGVGAGSNIHQEYRTDSYADGERHLLSWTTGSGATVAARYGAEYNTGRNAVDFVWREMYNGGVSSAENARLTGGGRLGLGTSNPSTKLQISGSHVANQGLLYITGTDYSYLSAEAPAAGEAGFFFNRAGTSEWIVGIQGASGGGGDKLYFSEGTDLVAGARLTLEAGGNVGIGTSSPLVLLHVVKNQAAATIAGIGNSNAAGTVGVSLASDTSSGNFTVAGTTATGLPGVAVAGEVLLESSTNATGLLLQAGRTGASTQPMRFAAGGSERMTLLSNGRVGIGTTSPSYRLHVRQDQAATSVMAMHNATAAGAALMVALSDSGNVQIYGIGSTNAGLAAATAGEGLILAEDANLVIQAGLNGVDTNVIKFATNAAVHITLDAAGLTGFGTTPSHKVDVAGNVNVSTGSAYKVNGTDVLSASTLGSGVTASSLTSVGTLTSVTTSGSLSTQATSPTAFTGAQNNFSIGSFSFARLDGSTTPSITGIVANNVDGHRLVLANVGAEAISITNQDGNSTAANRIITGTGASFSLAVDATIELIYDAVTARWRKLL